MTRAELARKLGLDRNPLRRRSDKIALGLTAGALAAFLAGAPFLALAAASWVGHAANTEQAMQRGWRQVPAVLGKDAAAPGSINGGYFADAWVPARWSAPDGRARTGEIPVAAGLPAGHTVLLWVNASGTPTGAPTRPQAVPARKIFTAAFAVVVLGLILAYLTTAGTWLLDRRRLADWSSEWAVIEPQWTRRFWSHG